VKAMTNLLKTMVINRINKRFASTPVVIIIDEFKLKTPNLLTGCFSDYLSLNESNMFSLTVRRFLSTYTEHFLDPFQGHSPPQGRSQRRTIDHLFQCRK